jgi:predicted dehydrogenase
MNIREQRRSFIKKSSTLAAGLMVAPGIIRAQENKPKLNIGLIGLSGKGASNLSGVLTENIVALCDVDENNAVKARSAHPNAKFFQDYRKLIDLKELDAIVVSTPDHVHAVQAIAVMQSGRPVYCEKPLAHSVLEVRKMVKIANEKGLVTQMGTQIHAGNNYRRVVEIIQAGVLGEISRVQVWVNSLPNIRTLSKTPVTVPAGFDYDLWLGPVAHRPYDPAFTHFNWRYFWEFGGGVFADMACHYMDLVHWSLDLRKPLTVEAVSKRIQAGDQTVPDLVKADYNYPMRGKKPAVHLTWYNGVKGPGWDHVVPYHGFASGILFEGTKGQLIADYSKYKLMPEDKFKGFTAPPATIPNSIGHHQEWVDAIKNKKVTTCNFDYSGALAETVLLGNVSLRSGAKISWDDAKGTTGNKDADKFLFREYRKGWTL